MQSLDTERICALSGEKQQRLTASWWASIRRNSFAEVASNSRTVQSAPAVTTMSSRFEIVTQNTAPKWPWNLAARGSIMSFLLVCTSQQGGRTETSSPWTCASRTCAATSFTDVCPLPDAFSAHWKVNDGKSASTSALSPNSFWNSRIGSLYGKILRARRKSAASSKARSCEQAASITSKLHMYFWNHICPVRSYSVRSFHDVGGRFWRVRAMGSTAVVRPLIQQT
eukprot:832978-Rhodomonas_salina.2